MDCTEGCVCTCPRFSGKGWRSAPDLHLEMIYEDSTPELHPEVIYESSAPELHPGVIYESSYTHFPQLCWEDNPQRRDRAGSLAGNCLSLGVELGQTGNSAFPICRMVLIILLPAKNVVLSSRGKLRVGVAGADDPVSVLQTHINVSQRCSLKSVPAALLGRRRTTHIGVVFRENRLQKRWKEALPAEEIHILNQLKENTINIWRNVDNTAGNRIRIPSRESLAFFSSKVFSSGTGIEPPPKKPRQRNCRDTTPVGFKKGAGHGKGCPGGGSTGPS